MKQLRYVIYVPKCTPQRGEPWLAVDYGRSLRKRCLEAFCPNPAQWSMLKRAGWSIVRVEVSE